MEKIKDWINKNRLEVSIVLVVLLVSGFLRLWNIGGYLDFKGDEGRDMRVVRRLIVDFDPVLVGPRTSVGDMYLGPLYYYLITPSLALSNLSPVGPAVLVALLGVFTVGFVWWVGREWFGKVAAVSAATLYAVSPVVIENTRDSWNPNVMPFFALLSIYSIWRVWQKEEWKWLLILGIAYAFVLQSHYLGLLLLPTLGLVWLAVWRAIRKTEQIKNFRRFSLLGLASFLLLMSPLVIFDARHGWRNFSAMKTFFTHRQTTVSARPWNALPELWPLWEQNVVERLMVGKNEQYATLFALLILLGLVWVGYRFYKENQEARLRAFGFTFLWLIAGLIGLGLYKQSVFDHYLGFMFPAPFLLLGAVLGEAWRKRFKWSVITLVGVLVILSIQRTPVKYPPNNELARTEAINEKIIEESGGKPFNFALIARNNYEEGYLYFFELWGAAVREIDPQRPEETITEQLFVVCEDQPTEENPNPCDVVNHPKAEIANFGWAEVVDEWEVGGFKIFKLVHTK